MRKSEYNETPQQMEIAMPFLITKARTGRLAALSRRRICKWAEKGEAERPCLFRRGTFVAAL